MADIKEFPHSQPAPDPPEPGPPAACARDLLEGKCTVRFTIWLTDTLLGRLQKIAEDYDTTVSDLLRQYAAKESARQTLLNQTTSDAASDLERCLALAREDIESGAITDAQILWLMDRIARFQLRVLEGRKAA
jgi:predicted transcriptional regulator